jgi:hypothetical protein
MPDYQKGKIYKLYSPSKNIIYYGSTIEPLSTRLSKHNYNYKAFNKDNTKQYCLSYLVLDCEDYKIELVEECPCNNKSQLVKKEGEYIKNNECVNMCIAGRTNKEWYYDNKEKIKAEQKKWRETNKEYKKEQAKKYYEDNKEKIAKKRKQYYLLNKK